MQANIPALSQDVNSASFCLTANVRPVLDRVTDFAALIADQADDAGFAVLRSAERTGRPLGTADFIAGLERILRRPIARRAPGRKPKQQPHDQLKLI
ncbi:MAG: hypothetical protein WCE20_10800 [Rhizomicrobium sp.]